MINRRTLLTTALTLGAMKAFPGLSYAQARPLVFATFTGSWEEAHKAVLVPAFRKANADASIVLDPMLSVDQIAKVNAARANPPIDVMLHDPGPALVAIGQDIVEPFPVEKSTYYKDLIAEAQEPMGPAPFFQVVGSYLQSGHHQDATDLLGRSLEAGVQGKGRHHQPQFDARHRMACRGRQDARRLGSQYRPGLQGA